MQSARIVRAGVAGRTSLTQDFSVSSVEEQNEQDRRTKDLRLIFSRPSARGIKL